MPPKKHDVAKVVKPNSNVLAPDQSGQGNVVFADDKEELSEEGTDPLRFMLQTFLQKQRQRDEDRDKEMQSQEHRWHALHHQFIQLQSEVHQ